MKALYIEATDTIPSVNFNIEENIIDIRGRSIMENANVFYEQVIDSVLNNNLNKKEYLTVNLYFEYLNTVSIKWIYYALGKIKEDYKIKVNWMYDEDDEAILDLGMDMETLLDFSFKLIPICV